MTCWSVSGVPSTSASTSRLRMSSSGCARRRLAQLVGEDGHVHRALGGGRGRHRVARLAGEEVVGPAAGIVVARRAGCRAWCPRPSWAGARRTRAPRRTRNGPRASRAARSSTAHARLQLRDAAGREPARDELAHLRVLGRIHLDHRLQGGVGVLDRDAAGRRVRVGVVQRRRARRRSATTPRSRGVRCGTRARARAATRTSGTGRGGTRSRTGRAPPRPQPPRQTRAEAELGEVDELGLVVVRSGSAADR